MYTKSEASLSDTAFPGLRIFSGCDPLTTLGRGFHEHALREDCLGNTLSHVDSVQRDGTSETCSRFLTSVLSRLSASRSTSTSDKEVLTTIFHG